MLSTLLYWMVGLNPDTNAFLIYIGFIFIHALVAEGFQTFVAILGEPTPAWHISIWHD